MSETESVRISSDLKAKVAEMSKAIRPKTTTQAVIEHAIELYLEKEGHQMMVAAEELSKKDQYKTKRGK